MTYQGVHGKLVGAVVAAALLLCAPAISANPAPTPKVKIDRKKARGIGFFAPVAADPRQAALFDRVGGSFAEPNFRFTPSGGSSKRAVTVAIRARNNRSNAGMTVAVNSPAINAGLAPSAYSLGASLGWKHFALSGDFARIDGGAVPDDRQLADIGVSYSGSKWSTRLLFGAERATGQNNLGGPDEALSVDLGGSYSLTRNLELSGGLRYKTQRERLDMTSDLRRDSQAIYIGTAFRF
ncbi:porin [Rhizorhabdus argentea]|uniref:porin n=1 Tax=Rhizorhabdus argentea TaxID=1387174 RepID=UPI0030EC96E7